MVVGEASLPNHNRTIIDTNYPNQCLCTGLGEQRVGNSVIEYLYAHDPIIDDNIDLCLAWLQNTN